jgi:hypothetical protein
VTGEFESETTNGKDEESGSAILERKESVAEE